VATAKVNIDYHVEVERHYYSVPTNCPRVVEVRLTSSVVEVFFKNKRVPRTCAVTTRDATPLRLLTCPIRTAATSSGRRAHRRVGREERTATGQFINELLLSRPHPNKVSAQRSA